MVWRTLVQQQQRKQWACSRSQWKPWRQWGHQRDCLKCLCGQREEWQTHHNHHPSSRSSNIMLPIIQTHNPSFINPFCSSQTKPNSSEKVQSAFFPTPSPLVFVVPAANLMYLCVCSLTADGLLRRIMLFSSCTQSPIQLLFDAIYSS